MDKQEFNSSKILLVNGKPLLKQFDDLTSNDFNEHPVWVECHIIDYDEEWYDDTDEETFRPWIDTIPVSPDFATFLIKAELKLNDGAIYPGFITPGLKSQYKDENELGLIQPQIFTGTGKRIGFWTGMFPLDRKEIDEFYKCVDKNADQIFPIDFEAVKGLSVGVISGRINGFLTITKRDGVLITK